MGEPLLQVDRLSTYFFSGAGVVRAVEDVSFHVDKGESLGIVGESGSGKTATALSILGIVPPPGRVVAGSIHFKDQELLGKTDRDMQEIRGKEIGYISQDPTTTLDPVFTIGEQLVEVIMRHQHVSKRDAVTRAQKLLELVEIPDPYVRANQYPHQLSGGMRQRVAIARALSCNPSLLIADEPTTALDVTTQAQILDLIEDLKKRLNMSLVLITHDLGIIASTCNRVTVLYAGQVCETGPVVQVFEDPQHPYTEALLASAPHLSLKNERLAVIPGSIPNLVNAPTGCRFNPRCNYAVQLCVDKIPPLDTSEDGHYVACHRAVELELKSPLRVAD